MDFIKKRPENGGIEGERKNETANEQDETGKRGVNERWKEEGGGTKTDERKDREKAGNRCVSPSQIRLGDVIKIEKMCLMNIHLCLDLLILNGLGSVRFEYCHPPLCRRHAAD